LIVIATYLKPDSEAGAGKVGSWSDLLAELPYFGVATTTVYEFKKMRFDSGYLLLKKAKL